MENEANDTPALTKDIPADSPPEPDYEAWLKGQLTQTVAELNDPGRVEIDHDEVFERLDGIIANLEQS